MIKKIQWKECNYGPFLIKYWASGSGDTYIGISKIPFRDAQSDWDEGFETNKIYTTKGEAERVILESTKQRLKQYCKENNIWIEEK